MQEPELPAGRQRLLGRTSSLARLVEIEIHERREARVSCLDALGEGVDGLERRELSFADSAASSLALV